MANKQLDRLHWPRTPSAHASLFDFSGKFQYGGHSHQFACAHTNCYYTANHSTIIHSDFTHRQHDDTRCHVDCLDLFHGHPRDAPHQFDSNCTDFSQSHQHSIESRPFDLHILEQSYC